MAPPSQGSEPPANPARFSTGIVHDIDRNGSRLWVSAEGGLFRVETSADRPPYLQAATLSSGNGVGTIYGTVMVSGRLWARGQSGLFLLEGSEDDRPLLRPVALADGTPIGIVTTIEHKLGHLWVRAATGVFRVADPSGNNPSLVPVLRPDGSWLGRVSGIEEAGGDLWIRGWSGLYRVDASHNTGTELSPVKLPNGARFGDVAVLAVDSGSRLWVGGQIIANQLKTLSFGEPRHEGLYRFDINNGDPPGLLSVPLPSTSGHRAGEASRTGRNLQYGQEESTRVRALAESRERLWVGTQFGIHRVLGPSGKNPSLQSIPLTGGTELGAVIAIEEQVGETWVHTDRGMFRIVEPESDQPRLRPVTTPAGSEVGAISTVRTSSGRMWVGTSSGLYRYDKVQLRQLRATRIASPRHALSNREIGVAVFGIASSCAERLRVSVGYRELPEPWPMAQYLSGRSETPSGQARFAAVIPAPETLIDGTYEILVRLGFEDDSVILSEALDTFRIGKPAWQQAFYVFLQSGFGILTISGSALLLIAYTGGYILYRWRPVTFFKHASRLANLRIPFKSGAIRVPADVFIGGNRRHHPRVMDAWIEANLDLISSGYSSKVKESRPEDYIQLPVDMEDAEAATLDDCLRATLRGVSPRFFIFGPGGIGKTMLASWIGGRVLDDITTKGSGAPSGLIYHPRLLPHRMIPVVIDADLAADNIDSAADAVVALLTQYGLKQVNRQLVDALSRERRLLLIVDRLSELSDQTVSMFRATRMLPADGGPDIEKRPVFPDAPLVITARYYETLNRLVRPAVQVLKPKILSERDLTDFVDERLHLYTRQDAGPTYNGGGLLDLSNQIYRFLRGEGRTLTALQADLALKRYVELSAESTNGAVNLGKLSDLYEGHVRWLDSNPKDSDLRPIGYSAGSAIADAKATAWACLQPDLLPSDTQRDKIKKALEDFSVDPNATRADARLDYLTRGLQLFVEPRTGALQPAIDPITEHLAALHLLEMHGRGDTFWTEHFPHILKEAEAKADRNLTSIDGFHDALLALAIDAGRDDVTRLLRSTKVAA